MDRRHVVLRTRLDPLHRTVELAAQRERERLLGVDVELRSEAAAHVRRDDPQLVLRDPGRDREADPRDVRDLRRRGEGELARRRASVRQAPTGFHRVRDQTRLRVPLLDDHRGGVEDTLIAGAAVDPVHDVVRAEILVDHDPVGRRLLEVEDCGERGRSNRDRLHRILGLLASLRDDDRHRVAGEPDLVGRQRVVRRDLDVLRVGPDHREAGGPFALEVRPGVHRDHTGHRRGVGRVYSFDRCVDIGRTHERDPDHARHRLVVDETAFAR